jgi:hypothetical protein
MVRQIFFSDRRSDDRPIVSEEEYMIYKMSSPSDVLWFRTITEDFLIDENINFSTGGWDVFALDGSRILRVQPNGKVEVDEWIDAVQILKDVFDQTGIDLRISK